MITNKKPLILIMVIFTTYLVGCASAGESFNYENLSSLELGETKSSDYVRLFGDPITVETKENSNGSFQLVFYAYATANIGNASARDLNLEFRDGLLNAYSYVSSFKEDQTLADMGQLSVVERATTRGSDIEDILGEPNGKARCPSEVENFKSWCSTGAEVWVWRGLNRLSTFGSVFGGAQPNTNSVFVVLDNEGLVVDFGTARYD